MSQHDDPDQHDIPRPLEEEINERMAQIGHHVANARGFQRWLDENGYGKKVTEGLDIRKMQRVFSDHEREHHNVKNPLPIDEECLLDVKRRYDTDA